MYRNHKLFLTTISAILLLTSPHTMAEVSTVDNSGATWSIIKPRKQGHSRMVWVKVSEHPSVADQMKCKPLPYYGPNAGELVQQGKSCIYTPAYTMDQYFLNCMGNYSQQTKIRYRRNGTVFNQENYPNYSYPIVPTSMMDWVESNVCK